jgi:hypothetical protein
LRDFKNAYAWYEKANAQGNGSATLRSKYINALMANAKYQEAYDWCNLAKYELSTDRKLLEYQEFISRNVFKNGTTSQWKLERLDLMAGMEKYYAQMHKDGVFLICSSYPQKSLLNLNSHLDSLESLDNRSFSIYYAQKNSPQPEQKFFEYEQESPINYNITKLSLPTKNDALLKMGPMSFIRDTDTLFITFIEPFEKRNSNLGILKAVYKNNALKTISAFPKIAEAYNLAYPSINKFADTLFFASDMPGGFGGYDLYFCRLQQNGSWSAPVNLGPKINTPKDETFPYWDSMGTLYFSSEGHMGYGALDIFKVGLSNGTVTDSVSNLGYPFNSSADDFGFSISPNGQSGLLSSNRENFQKDEIYHFAYTAPKKIMIRCKVLDNSTKWNLDNVTIMAKNVLNQPLDSAYTNNSGICIINSPFGQMINLTISKNGYDTLKVNIHYDELENNLRLFFLQPKTSKTISKNQ